MTRAEEVRKELAPGIIAYPGVLTPEQCQALIKHHDEEKLKLIEVPDDKNTNQSYTRDCTTVFVNQLPKWKSDKDMLIEAIRPYVIDYNDRFAISLGIRDTGFEFVKYEEGKVCKIHCDRNENRLGVFGSMSLALNNCEGGELVFPEQKLAIPMEAGSAFFFPSTYSYPHFTNPAKGPRYVVITFLRYEKGRL